MASSSSPSSKEAIGENRDAASSSPSSKEAIGENRDAASSSPSSKEAIGENRDAATPQANQTDDSDESTPPLSPTMMKSSTDLMVKVFRYFRDRKFAKSSEVNEQVLKLLPLIDNQPGHDDLFVLANLYKGLALQAHFRVEDDLMTEALPMEADYGVHGSTFVAKEVPGDDNLEPAGLYLVDAKTMLDKQPGDSVAKVDVLSALGELELKKRNYMDSFKHYREALSIMERLVEPDNQRIAHLNFKICMCLAKCNDIKQATEYCVKAISICKNRIQRLNSSPGPSSSAPDAGLSLLDKAGDIGKFELLLREFERKLLILQHPLMSSSPTDSSFDSPNINTRMQKQSGIEASGTKRQLSPDPASKEPMSATSKQPGGPEHSPPTAGKEVKRQLFPDSSSTESTPTKKHSLGPSSTEEDKEGTP